MNPAYLGLIILLLPTAAFAILALFHNRIPRHGDWLGTGAMFIALLLAVYIFAVAGASGRYDDGKTVDRLTRQWLTLDRRAAPAAAETNGVAKSGAAVIGLQIDNLTAIMLVVVTAVSFAIQLFSIGYMRGDSKYGRYYASLSMFTASMLGLVLSDNLLTLYISWEIMGLASYILIGHFLHKPSANDASLKAFIVTRIGDVGMFLAIVALYWQTGSFRFDDIFAAVESGALAGKMRFWCAMGLFFGAMGKSAQFPLHVWLPDAMEGPTPVSALIHAATMVAAGVYLVGRSYVLFPVEALLVVAYVGAFTAIMSATIAVVQTDIKKVLAYSTVSQLGYMMIGLGCFGYYAGLGHLTTHAFFKACLFLGSGSVIHAMHHNQEMDRYGGLWRKLPVTFATFLIATLALTGFPYVFSGFHTKDAIIAKAFELGMATGKHQILGFLAAAAAMLTSFYMFRLVFLTFFGKPKDHHLYEHARESPWVMVVPLVALACLSLWFVGGPAKVQTGPNLIQHMLAMPAQKEKEIEKYLLAQAPPAEALAPGAAGESDASAEARAAAPGEHGAAQRFGHLAHEAHLRAVRGSLIVFPAGVIIAAVFYLFGWLSAAKFASAFRPVYVFLRNLWYIDHFYQYTAVKPFLFLCRFSGGVDKYGIDGVANGLGLLTRFKSWVIGLIDSFVVDGLYNGGAWTTQWFGRMAARAQTGRVRVYLLSIMLGAIALILLFVFVFVGG